jgi:hypothetical protein
MMIFVSCMLIGSIYILLANVVLCCKRCRE